MGIEFGRKTVLASAALVLGIGVQSAAGEDATVVAPEHYKVEFENDKVRVIRITYGPGEESKMHEHGDAVVVNLTPSNIAFTLPDGSTPATEPGAAGVVIWSDAGSHAARNTGSQPFEGVMIELKN
jgi:hypothetical protein